MPKMTDITLNEVSVVDYPAHGVQGFAVMKADSTQNRALLSALRKETMPTPDLADVLKGASVEDIRKALSDDQLAELAPEIPVLKSAEVEEVDVLKGVSPEVRAEFEKRDEMVAKALADAASAREEADIAKAARLDETAITKSKETYTNLGFEHDVVAPALRKFADANPEAVEAIETMLKAVNAQADGAIFKELGTTQEPVEKSAADQLTALAKARASEDKVDFAKAYETVVAENPALVAAHFKENI